MQRKGYRASAVKEAFWFQPFRKLVKLRSEGNSYTEIRRLNEEKNIFGAATETRRKQIFNTVTARCQCLDDSFYPVFLQGNIVVQKQLTLAAVLANDTLFFDFVYEVIHEKIQLGNMELRDADIQIFFHRKQAQDERAAKWTEQTLKRLGRTYRAILTEVGILEKKKGNPRKIYPLFLDDEVKVWLSQHHLQEIIVALSE